MTYLKNLLPTTLKDWLLCALLGVAIYQCIMVPKYLAADLNARADRTEKLVLNGYSHVMKLMDQSRLLITETRKTVQMNQGELQLQSKSVTKVLESSNTLVSDLRANMLGGIDSNGLATTGLVSESRLLIGDSRVLVQSMTKDLHTVMQSTDTDLKTLDRTLVNMETLLATVDTQIKTGGPVTMETIASLNQAIKDIDKLVADPNIAKTISNVQYSTESVDIALRPWRERANLLKTILFKALGMLKIVYAF